MKIRLSNKQREKSKRIFATVGKMMKATLLILAASLLADKTVFNVVKDQITGTVFEPLEDT